MSNNSRERYFDILLIAVLLLSYYVLINEESNDGGKNRYFTEDEVTEKQHEIELQTQDATSCYEFYRLHPHQFKKLHDLLAPLVKTTPKLPLFFQIAINLGNIVHYTKINQQHMDFRVSRVLIVRTRGRCGTMDEVYPQVSTIEELIELL